MNTRTTHRSIARYLGGTKVEYTCPNGHKTREDLGRKSLPRARRLGETGVRMMASWWNDGVTRDCPKCQP